MFFLKEIEDIKFKFLMDDKLDGTFLFGFLYKR